MMGAKAQASRNAVGTRNDLQSYVGELPNQTPLEDPKPKQIRDDARRDLDDQEHECADGSKQGQLHADHRNGHHRHGADDAAQRIKLSSYGYPGVLPHPVHVQGH